jgi:hypothetical protein
MKDTSIATMPPACHETPSLPLGLVVAFPGYRVTIIAVLSIIRVVVHSRYFLQIDFNSSPRENILALAWSVLSSSQRAERCGSCSISIIG